MTSLRYGIAWVIDFKFFDVAWWRDTAQIAAAVDVLAEARWWREFHMLARGYGDAAPFDSLDEVKAAIATGEPAIATVGRGAPSVAVWHDDPDAVLKLEAAASGFHIMFRLMRDSLARHADAVLADTREAVLTLASRWRAAGRLAYCVGFPYPPNQIAYPRVRPPRRPHRRLDAVLDIVDPELPPGLVGPIPSDDARALATAPMPSNVEREERDGVVAMRWVQDPTDVAQMAIACAAHERWAAPLLYGEIYEGWNAAGDSEIPIAQRAPAPTLSFIDPASGIGYVELADHAESGVAIDAQLQSARAARAAGVLVDGTALHGVTVIASDRAHALRLAAVAREANLAVAYRDGDKIWDPFPAGNWQDVSD